MQKPSKITVLFGRFRTVTCKSTVVLDSVRPVFQRKGRVGNCKIKATEHGIILIIFIMRVGECISGVYFSRCFIVQNKVHFCKTGSGDLFFLAVNSYIDGSLICRSDQQGAGSAGRVIDRCVRVGYLINPDNLCKNSGNLGRSIKLPFALSALRSKVAHQIFVCVTENIIPASFIVLEIKFRTLKNGNQTSELVHHFLTLAELCLVIEMCVIYHSAKIIVFGFSEFCNHLVHFFANIFVPLECNKVVKTSAFRDGDVCIFDILELIGNIFDKQKCQYVILILRGIHSASEFIATCPQGAV